jgi:uncharacterized damage-inducible protein DinB
LFAAMGRAALDEYLYLVDESFAGDDWHSLMTNVKAVSADEWLWVAPGGARPVGEMVSHLAGCKNMYEDHAFGPGTLTWADPRAEQKLRDATPAGIDALLARLVDAQRRLRSSVAGLADDAELRRPRRTNWGELKETRWIIKALIEHDLYHAGEINHLRSLRHADDRWAFDRF